MSNFESYEAAEKRRLDEENAVLLADQMRMAQNEKQAKKDSQAVINTTSDSAEYEFNTLSEDRAEYTRWEAALEDARRALRLLLRNLETLFPVDETTFTERKTKEAKLWRAAYYALPVLDALFVFVAILPIALNLLTGNRLGGITLAIPLAILLGGGITMLTRWGQSWSEKYRHIFLNLASLIVPALYWTSYALYGGSLGYTICFSAVSLAVQLTIVYGFEKQMWAFAYLKDKEANDDLRTKRDNEVAQRQREVEELEEKIEEYRKHGFKVQFNDRFGGSFRELAQRWWEYMSEYGNEPFINLGQRIRYLGNVFFYGVIVIPLLENNGNTDAIDILNPLYITRDFIEKVDEDWYFIIYMRKGDFSTTFTESLKEANGSTPKVQVKSNHHQYQLPN